MKGKECDSQENRAGPSEGPELGGATPARRGRGQGSCWQKHPGEPRRESGPAQGQPG